MMIVEEAWVLEAVLPSFLILYFLVRVSPQKDVPPLVRTLRALTVTLPVIGVMFPVTGWPPICVHPYTAPVVTRAARGVVFVCVATQSLVAAVQWVDTSTRRGFSSAVIRPVLLILAYLSLLTLLVVFTCNIIFPLFSPTVEMWAFVTSTILLPGFLTAFIPPPPGLKGHETPSRWYVSDIGWIVALGVSVILIALHDRFGAAFVEPEETSFFWTYLVSCPSIVEAAGSGVWTRTLPSRLVWMVALPAFAVLLLAEVPLSRGFSDGNNSGDEDAMEKNPEDVVMGVIDDSSDSDE